MSRVSKLLVCERKYKIFLKKCLKGGKKNKKKRKKIVRQITWVPLKVNFILFIFHEHNKFPD